MTRHTLTFVPQLFVATLMMATLAYGQNPLLPPMVTPADPAAGPLDSGNLGASGFGAESIPPGQSQPGSLHFPDQTSPGDLASPPDPMDFGRIINGPLMGDPAYDEWHCQPALTESTGTWLRRGWWYTEIDAVVLNRMWKRDDVTLAQDTASTRSLLLKRSDPGASGSARLTLGRFLFRDGKNRDHTAEFTIFGGGEWFQDDNLTSDGGGTSIFVPTGISDANIGFDQSAAMSVNYSSRFTSIELNYRVKERMRRDRMEFMPSGEWVRRANPGITKQYLVGLRYFDLNDTLDWQATNIASQGGQNGRYILNTNNDMFGVQLGCVVLLEHDRWNVEVGGKGGAFVNDSKANSNMAITNTPATSFSFQNRETALSFVGECQVIGRYHLRPHLSLRAGWQMMYVTSVALAPDQITFAPDAGRFPHTGDPFYNGGIFGFEGYW